MKKSPPTIYDHDAVLELWATGISSKMIAQQFGMKRPQSVSAIVSRGREKGDPRALRRREPPGDPKPDEIVVALKGLSVVPGMREEAKRRGVSVATLANELLEAIVTDKMFEAILE